MKALEPELQIAIDLHNIGGYMQRQAAITIENQYIELRRLAEVNAELLGALKSVRPCVEQFAVCRELVILDRAIAKTKEQQ